MKNLNILYKTRATPFLITLLIFIFPLECLYATNRNVEHIQSFSEEFMSSGGKFGNVNDSQKRLNTQILISIFKRKNSISLNSKEKIQTMDLSLVTQNHSIIRNVILDNYYSKKVEYTIGVSKGVSYQDISNLTLTCHNKDLCRYGIKYGFDEKTYSEGCTINNVTISNYFYPLLLFSWNSVIGRIDCFNCEYGPILLGTSLSIGAIFCNGCKNGPILGGIIDDNGGVAYNKNKPYLTYSSIDVISTDGQDVGFCLGLGCVKYITIETIGMEARKSQSLISSFYKASCFLTIGTIVPEYCPRKFYHNYDNDKSPDNLNVSAIFGENIYGSFENSDIVNINLERGDSYISKLKNTATNIHLHVPYQGAPPMSNDVFWCSSLINGGGRNDGYIIQTSNSYGKYAGVITNNQILRIKLRGSATPSASNEAINRQIIFLGKIIIGDADQYNAQHVLGESLLNLTIDYYKKDGVYNVIQSSSINGVEFEVDSSEDLPSLIIRFPRGHKTKSYNYAYNLECIGGASVLVDVSKE